MIRALPRVALQLWIVLFIVFFGAEVIHLEPTLRIVTQVAYGLPLAAWAAWRLRGPLDRLDWAVLGLLLVYAGVCIFSRDRTESLGTLALATAYAAWFLLMRRAAELRRAIVLSAATGFAITLAFNAFLAIQEKATWYATVGGAPFEAVMTFPWESVNALSILVLVAIPFVAWLGRSPISSLLGTALVGSAVIVVPISLGRAGWLGLAVAAAVLVVTHPASTGMLRRLPPAHRALLAVGGTVAFAAALVLIGPRLIAAIGESGRLLLWQQDLSMISSSPLLGFGPGTYSWARLEFPPATADLLAVRLTHSVPLQTLVDGGLILLAAVVAVGGVWAATALRSSWRVADRLAFACILGFLAALTLDDFGYLPAITAAAVAIAALLVPAADFGNTGGPTPRWSGAGVLAVAALVGMPGVIAVDAARSAAQSARTAMVAGAYDQAMDGFAVASRAHPENGGYWLGLGMSAAYSEENDIAVTAYERAIAVSPGDARGYGALADLDPDADRVGLLRLAADRTLGDPQYAVRLGLALAADGLMHDATHAWARAVALSPQLIRVLPYDQSGISLESVADEAVLMIQLEPRPAPEANLEALWEIRLALDELPADAGVAWRAVDAARHDDFDRANDLAAQAVAMAPWDARAHQALAAIAAFACDPNVEEAALEQERVARGAHARPPMEPSIRREFVHREASLGPSQPPGVGLGLEIERWPWSLVDLPECNQ